MIKRLDLQTEQPSYKNEDLIRDKINELVDAVNKSQVALPECPECNGKGQVVVHKIGADPKNKYWADCMLCNGTGKVALPECPERHPMTYDQNAQIDCRVIDCNYYKGAGKCNNISPALTLNKNKTFVCWSKKSVDKVALPREDIKDIKFGGYCITCLHNGYGMLPYDKCKCSAPREMSEEEMVRIMIQQSVALSPDPMSEPALIGVPHFKEVAKALKGITSREQGTKEIR